VNVDVPAVGAAVNVTLVPWPYGSVQSEPQEIPAGALVTVPVPVPAFATVRRRGMRANVAVTALAASIVTVHVVAVGVVAQPVKPVNVDVAVVGAAVSVTLVPVS